MVLVPYLYNIFFGSYANTVWAIKVAYIKTLTPSTGFESN